MVKKRNGRVELPGIRSRGCGTPLRGPVVWAALLAGVLVATAGSSEAEFSAASDHPVWLAPAVDSFSDAADLADFSDLGDIDGEDDPLEPLNRYTHELNRQLLWFTARPIAIVYGWMIPEPVRDGFRNTLDNLALPLVFGNLVLEGDFQGAKETFLRTLINSTFGIGGIFDVASRYGLPKRTADFGMTMASLGVGEGPYLILPLLGPTIPRDLAAAFGQGFVDPFNRLVQHRDFAFPAFLLRFVLGNIDLYERRMDDLDLIEVSSVDFYAALRNLYRQQRRATIRQRFFPDEPPSTGVDYDLELD